LITTGADGRIVAWSLKDIGMVVIFEEATSSDAHANARSVLALSPDGRHLVVAGNDGQLLIYALATGRIKYRVNAGGRQIDDAAYSSDGSALATVRPDGRVDLWDVSDLEEREPGLIAWFSLHSQPRAVAFLPHEKAFAIATATGHLVIFSPNPKAWRLRAEAVAPKH
jgi:WD40 repeat protein